MKADIHPKYETVTATCSCGNKIETRSTLCEDLHIDVRLPTRAKSNEIAGVRDGRLLVRTPVAPADGRANHAVAEHLAESLGVAPSRIERRRGSTQCEKQFLVKGLLRG